MRPVQWLPPVMWMGVILWLASDHGSSSQTGRFLVPILHFLFPGASPLQIDVLHAATRKLAHATEYAILAGLWFRAFALGTRFEAKSAAGCAWVIAVAWAVIDETYQSTLASRTGSPTDVALDATGALAVALLGACGWRPVADSLATALLWVAAVGGAVLVAVNLLTGVGSGVLWATVPAAVLAIVVARRRRTSARPRP
jgi:VanZ family protein